MPAHHHRDIDAFQRQIVEIGAGEGLRDEPRRRRIARRVVEADEIVVDRLGDMDRPQLMVGFLGLLGDDAHRVGGIVAADVEEGVDRMRFQNLEDLLAIFAVRLVAGRAESRGGRRRDRLEVRDRLLAQIDQIIVDDAAHALERAIDMADVGKPSRLERHAGQRLVDDRSRTASLGDKDLVRHVFSLRLASAGLKPRRARAKALGGARVTRKHADAGSCPPGWDSLFSRVEPGRPQEEVDEPAVHLAIAIRFPARSRSRSVRPRGTGASYRMSSCASKSAANAYPVHSTVAVAWTRGRDVANSNRPSNEANTGPRNAAVRVTNVSAVNGGVCDFRRRSEASQRNKRNKQHFQFQHINPPRYLTSHR